MRPTSATPPPADRVEALLRGAADQVRRRTTDDEIVDLDDSAAEVARPALQVRRVAEQPPPRLHLPEVIRAARVRPAWGAAAGVAVIAVVVAVVLGVRVWVTRHDATPTPIPAASGATAGALASSKAAATATASGGNTGNTSNSVVVHVIGQVATPGVVRLPAGSRVSDALKAAGGATTTARLDAVNLARVLTDGEQIVVPAPGESVPPPAAPVGGAARPGGGAPAGGKIDLNTADAAALDALPGIGPVTAARIVDWRREHGRFSTVQELQEVPGIGPKLFAQVAPLVTV
ncbi:hypothetical protein KEM60_02692 [Austwickia sp. TVS 96-490-7B]|uniref:helix-hairpin-helix domain-containing protein n=1 Tax=Austwickia sp. TVS 96-490-7B TaxID=2830843 RepID=UPI001C5597F6|nr:helix-hairpin-helix domain-containing protein [Austwickia sp. TVS 96-490-7B]MBW3086471.1 hypothetical protein [Austwickia sp. TVS 96-490-7B]